MAYWEDLQKWRSPDGIVNRRAATAESPLTNGETGNNGYTWLAFILLIRRGEARDPKILADFEQTIRRCYVDGYPGLMNRAAVKIGDQEGWDDYILAVLAAKMLGSKVALEILAQGMIRRWFVFRWIYNNVNPEKPTWQSFLGRDPSFPAHLEWCAGKLPMLPRIAAQFFSLLFCGMFHVEQSTDCVLSWAMVQAASVNSALISLAADFFEFRMNRFWGSFKNVLAKYISPDHPIVEYWI